MLHSPRDLSAFLSHLSFLLWKLIVNPVQLCFSLHFPLLHFFHNLFSVGLDIFVLLFMWLRLHFWILYNEVPGLFFLLYFPSFFSFLSICTWLEICIYGIPNCALDLDIEGVLKKWPVLFFFQTVLQWAVWSILGVMLEASLCLVRGPNNPFCQWRFSQR